VHPSGEEDGALEEAAHDVRHGVRIAEREDGPSLSPKPSGRASGSDTLMEGKPVSDSDADSEPARTSAPDS
jgi:hypothetical protein